jgi:hypothetical protein
VKATSTPDSAEFNEVLKQLKDALRNIPTDWETRSPGIRPASSGAHENNRQHIRSSTFGLLLCLESNKMLRLDVV